MTQASASQDGNDRNITPIQSLIAEILGAGLRDHKTALRELEAAVGAMSHLYGYFRLNEDATTSKGLPGPPPSHGGC
ncbi:hypothetical protein BCON_0772g00020 [Botryotinia convoluta]|uniref:Uncharacterized protein n=1 Tax=Botryotinia convoluta TaxID=54673 RepID=A0A4Z1H423_9HELO|nr:hypothetical protein BCON_0772g00020 [Botryotinia convoluta]